MQLQGDAAVRGPGVRGAALRGPAVSGPAVSWGIRKGLLRRVSMSAVFSKAEIRKYRQFVDLCRNATTRPT